MSAITEPPIEDQPFIEQLKLDEGYDEVAKLILPTESYDRFATIEDMFNQIDDDSYADMINALFSTDAPVSTLRVEMDDIYTNLTIDLFKDFGIILNPDELSIHSTYTLLSALTTMAGMDMSLLKELSADFEHYTDLEYISVILAGLCELSHHNVMILIKFVRSDLRDQLVEIINTAPAEDDVDAVPQHTLSRVKAMEASMQVGVKEHVLLNSYLGKPLDFIYNSMIDKLDMFADDTELVNGLFTMGILSDVDNDYLNEAVSTLIRNTEGSTVRAHALLALLMRKHLS